MIVKIDHIALSSDDFEKSTGILNLLGYSPVFYESDVPNLPIKKAFLQSYSPHHAITLLQSGENLGIELLNHGWTGPETSYITPLFENVPPTFLKYVSNLGNNDRLFTIQKRLSGFEANVEILNKSDYPEFCFTKIHITTESISDSISFWNCFGFKPVFSDNETAVLAFSSVICRKVYEIHLSRVVHIRDRSYLDDSGFNCIAFISTSLKRDRQVLHDAGIPVTETGNLKLNNKDLNVFFCEGPYNEPIEIVEFAL